MKPEQYDGGPAFPVPPDQGCATGDPRDGMAVCAAGTGMSLRDYFAAAVLQGVMTNATGLGNMAAEARAELLKKMASIIYETSDAMLAARKEGA